MNNQLRDNDPPAAKQAYEKLLHAGYSASEAKEKIGAVVLEEIYDVMKENQAYDEKRYTEALNGLSFDTADLDVQLGREFGGRDFSGGQWQRAALARCIYKDADVMVLDEPTSAIDPLEESRLYHKFKAIMKRKIGVIVTHRIGAARLADRIIVMKDGNIAEQGTHEDLMRRKGIYYRMFCAQAQSYV